MIDMLFHFAISQHQDVYMKCPVRGVRVLRAELNKPGSRT